MHTYYLSAQSADQSPILVDQLQNVYRQKVGSLMFLIAQTRPELHYFITELSHRSFQATFRGMTAEDRVLKYCASTRHLNLPRQT